MSTLILDGRVVRDARTAALTTAVKALFNKPTLAIIQVGNREDSTAFIGVKTAFAEKIGVKVKHIHLAESSTAETILAKVHECNTAEDISGIIVQLPLPTSIDQDTVIEAISPKKDVDSLTSANVKMWLEGREDALLPATTRGVKELLEYYKISLFGKHVVVVGRSMLVGKPLAAFAVAQNATVTVCHSKTPDLAAQTRQADVLIVATGRPGLVKAAHVREGTIIIDIGINSVKGEKLEEEVPSHKITGDVDFDGVKDIAGAISPVPGGVGPMTVLALFENLVDLCNRP